MRNPIQCRGRTAELLFVVGAGAVAFPARADEVKPVVSSDAPGDLVLDPSFGLDPASPQIAALPGGVTPAFGQRSLSEEEWRFDFHGLITAPMNMGFNTRTKQGMTPGPG